MTPTRQSINPTASRAAGKPAGGRPTLRLYNTLTHRKEDFAPIDPNAVRLYVCGPTVYDFAHIGNARPVIVFDVLFRLLRHVYGADHVRYVRNITDVDDKIIARAERDYPALPLNEAIGEVTAATERQFHDDVAALGCLPPTKEPRATRYVGKMRDMIEQLVARGVAYVAEDHVLFSLSAMDRLPGAPRYGALAHRSLDEMLAGARVDVAPYKREPMDFVLWKPSKPNEPGWPSPGGIAALGRPGWHIECSAMSMATLLEPFGGGLECDDPSRNVFDIHGGGIDLVFPHHENEIAQSCSAFGSKRMANIWMHNGFLQVEGEKMAKSVGNFVTIHELLHTTKFGGRKWSGEGLRLAMLRSHYRQPIDWTVKALEEAEAALDRWYDAVRDASPHGEVAPGVIEALSDDLNTPAVLAQLHELARAGSRSDLRVSLQFLGFSAVDRGIEVEIHGAEGVTVADSVTAIVFRPGANGTWRVADEGVQKAIDDLIDTRKIARLNKNWAESDRLREQLSALGVAIKDNKDGTTTWEPKR